MPNAIALTAKETGTIPDIAAANRHRRAHAGGAAKRADRYIRGVMAVGCTIGQMGRRVRISIANRELARVAVNAVALARIGSSFAVELACVDAIVGGGYPEDGLKSDAQHAINI